MKDLRQGFPVRRSLAGVGSAMTNQSYRATLGLFGRIVRFTFENTDDVAT
jgi:hypothetical protein